MSEPKQGNEETTGSSWPTAFHDLGCGFMVLVFVVWLIGAMMTNNPLWFKGQ